MLKKIWARIWENYSPKSIGDWVAKTVPDLVSALLVFVIFYVLWLIASRVIRIVEKRIDIDPTLVSFIKTATKSTLLLIGVISALGELGINTGALLTSLGVAGLTLGFAAKDALSNLISGLFIFWDRPFVLGDLVEIDGVYGRVESITLRSTRVVTVDGKMLAVPNTTVVNSKVASYTNFPNLRLDIDITIGVNEDIGKVRALFLDLIKTDSRFLKKPEPQMVLTAVNDFNLAVQFRAWLDDEKQHIPVRMELREKIFETLRSNDIVMPYETLEVVMAASNPQPTSSKEVA